MTREEKRLRRLCAYCGERLAPHDTTWQQWQCAACGSWNDHEPISKSAAKKLLKQWRTV